MRAPAWRPVATGPARAVCFIGIDKNMEVIVISEDSCVSGYDGGASSVDIDTPMGSTGTAAAPPSNNTIVISDSSGGAVVISDSSGGAGGAPSSGEADAVRRSKLTSA